MRSILAHIKGNAQGEVLTARGAVAAASPGGSAPSFPRSAGSRLTCALVNNMPDAALAHTDRQFEALLCQALGREPPDLDLHRYSLPSIPRSSVGQEHVRASYLPFGHLFESRPDLVIVTGAAPTTPRVAEEPFWEDLATVIGWGVATAGSVMLSCLAAHAALLLFDGVDRTRLTAKRTGAFWHEVDEAALLTRGIRSPLLLPHSRWNEVPRAALADAGYEVAVDSPEAGWALASRRVEGCLLVLAQAHPEYEPTSLLREYRRDAGRFAEGTRTEEPPLPVRCVAPEDAPALHAWHRSLLEEGPGRRPPTGAPFDEMVGRVPWLWRDSAVTLYRNWASAVRGAATGARRPEAKRASDA